MLGKVRASELPEVLTGGGVIGAGSFDFIIKPANIDLTPVCFDFGRPSSTRLVPTYAFILAAWFRAVFPGLLNGIPFVLLVCRKAKIGTSVIKLVLIYVVNALSSGHGATKNPLKNHTMHMTGAVGYTARPMGTGVPGYGIVRPNNSCQVSVLIINEGEYVFG